MVEESESVWPSNSAEGEAIYTEVFFMKFFPQTSIWASTTCQLLLDVVGVELKVRPPSTLLFNVAGLLRYGKEQRFGIRSMDATLLLLTFFWYSSLDLLEKQILKLFVWCYGVSGMNGTSVLMVFQAGNQYQS